MMAAVGGDIAQKVAALMAKRAQAQADLDRLEESGETQLSRTDADARLLRRTARLSRATTCRSPSTTSTS